MMKAIEKILILLFGLLVGGMFMWMLDYTAYTEIMKEVLTKCGEPCL